MKLEFSRQIVEKNSNIKFNKNLSRGSRVVPCGQTDMTMLIVTFRNFVNAPKTYSFCPHSVSMCSVWLSKQRDSSLSSDWCFERKQTPFSISYEINLRIQLSFILFFKWIKYHLMSLISFLYRIYQGHTQGGEAPGLQPLKSKLKKKTKTFCKHGYIESFT